MKQKLEILRAATASMFYVVWTIVGVGVIAAFLLFLADPPTGWTTDPAPSWSVTPDLGTPAPYDTSVPR
jgi:hypothetical protein